MSAGLVITPGGPRPADTVHPVPPGTLISASDGVLRNVHPDGTVLAEFGAAPPLSDQPLALMADRVPPEALTSPSGLGTGWITYASWLNTTGTPISQFTAIWNVPAEPTTHDGQLLYLFNGMQNNAGYIYQPVLQWGASPAGGGNFWSVATWYAGPVGTQTFHSESAQRVNVGDELAGVMGLTDQSTDGFSYEAGFLGIPDAGWAIVGVPELNWLVITLEAYSMTQCADYPTVHGSTFSGIDIKQGTSRPSLHWTSTTKVFGCGQHVVVHSNAPDGGEVELFYN
jgi:hypothetical protein